VSEFVLYSIFIQYIHHLYVLIVINVQNDLITNQLSILFMSKHIIDQCHNHKYLYLSKKFSNCCFKMLIKNNDILYCYQKKYLIRFLYIRVFKYIM